MPTKTMTNSKTSISTSTTIAAALAFASSLVALSYVGTAAADHDAFPEEVPAQVYFTFGGTDVPATASLVDSSGQQPGPAARAAQASIGPAHQDGEVAVKLAASAPAQDQAIGTK